MSGPVEVTHYLCPETEGTGVTHHLRPERVGTLKGDISQEMVCVWCHRSEQDLRDDITANGGQLHPQISKPEPGPRHRL